MNIPQIQCIHIQHMYMHGCDNRRVTLRYNHKIAEINSYNDLRRTCIKLLQLADRLHAYVIVAWFKAAVLHLYHKIFQFHYIVTHASCSVLESRKLLHETEPVLHILNSMKRFQHDPCFSSARQNGNAYYMRVIRVWNDASVACCSLSCIILPLLVTAAPSRLIQGTFSSCSYKRRRINALSCCRGRRLGI